MIVALAILSLVVLALGGGGGGRRVGRQPLAVREDPDLLEGAIEFDHSDALNELLSTELDIDVPMADATLVVEVDARTNARTVQGRRTLGGEVDVSGVVRYALRNGRVEGREGGKATLRMQPDHAPAADVLHGTGLALIASTVRPGVVRIRIEDQRWAAYCRPSEGCGEDKLQSSYRANRAGDRRGDDLWAAASPGWVGEVQWALEE